MPAILVNDVSPVISYTATAGQTLFSIPFEFFAVQDIVVERAGVTLTYSPTPANNNQFSVIGANLEGGGSITLGSPGATLGDKIVIFRDIAIERLANYPETGPMAVRSLNAEQAKHIGMMQQLERDVNRGVTVPIGESAIDLPSAAERADKVLTFDENGNPETSFSTDILSGLAVSSGGVPAQTVEFVATASQTVFNFPAVAAVGFVSVFLNGVRLKATDFAHSGATVTLVTGATLGDTVTLEGFTQSAVPDLTSLPLLAQPTGSSLVGFLQSGTGAVATDAQVKQREWISVEDFSNPADTSDAEAFQRAINEANARGGAEVRALGSAYSFHQAVVLKTGVKLTGLGRAQATITKTAHTFSAFTDNAAALAFVDISGFKIRCATAATNGESDRGVLFDVQGASHTGFVRITDMAFENMFRGIEIDHVDHFEYDNIDGTDLLDSLIYVGEQKEYRSGYVKGGRVNGLRCLSSKGSDVGGGVVVLSYVDEVGSGDYKFTNCGPNDVTASINKFHGLYLRTCGDGDWGIVRGVNQYSGSHLHIFSDIAAGEQRSGNHIGILVCDGTTTYHGARISGGKSITFKQGTEISDSWFNAVYVDDYFTVTMVGRPRMINNNRSNTSGARDAAAVLIDDVKTTKLDLYCLDDVSTVYGQAGIVAFQGTCDTADVAGYIECLTAVADYAVVSHESGSLVKYPNYHDIVSIESKNFLNEAGTVTPAGQGNVSNINIVTTGGGPLLTIDQLHRWKCEPNCWQGGARFGYWSDGKNVGLWTNANPSTGTWVVGDEWKRATPSAAGVDGGVCVTAGTPGTWKYRAALEA